MTTELTNMSFERELKKHEASEYCVIASVAKHLGKLYDYLQSVPPGLSTKVFVERWFTDWIEMLDDAESEAERITSEAAEKESEKDEAEEKLSELVSRLESLTSEYY